MATAPSREVVDAIERGNTAILRSADIYESDGKTLWYPSRQIYVPDEDMGLDPPKSRLIDGSVSVDYSRSERRALDISLESEDNLLRVNPHDGLWYDKVMKVFRGLRYASDPRPPRLAIVEADTEAKAYQIRGVFLQLGFTRSEVDFFAEFMHDIADYEIIVSAMEFSATQKGPLLRQAYANGKKVITLSRYNSDDEIPFITDAVYRADAPWGIMPVAYDTPVKDSTVSVSTIRNEIPNPSMEIDLIKWATPRGNTSVVPAWHDSNKNAGRYVRILGETATSYIYCSPTTGEGSMADGIGSARYKYDPTKSYYVQFRAYNSSSMPLRFRGAIAFYEYDGSSWAGSSGSSIFFFENDGAGIDVVLQPGEERLLNDVLPSGYDNVADGVLPLMYCYEEVAGNMPDGGQFDWDHVMYVESNVPVPYFDGDSPRAYWVSTPHNSASIQTNTVSEGWGSEDYGTAEGWLPMAVDGTATPVATYLDGSTTYYAAIVAEHSSGGRWFDYHPYELGSQSKLLLKNATTWVWNYTPYKEWTVQVGEFVIDKITEANFPHQVKITGRDYAKKCITSRLEKSASFPAGTAVDELIAALAANAGITKMKLSTQVEPLPNRLDIERGTPRWEVMQKAAQANNLEIFFDNQGFLTTRPFVDPAFGALSWSFKTGSEGNLVEFTRSTNDSRLYNHIIVTGERENEDALPFFGEARNTEPSSPTRIERIGDRAYFFTSSFFTSNQQCQELAESWLKIHALESYEMDWSSINYPWLEVGEVVEFLDPRRSEIEPTRYLLNTLNIPLGLGPMSATGKRVTLVGEENTEVELPPEEGDVDPGEEPAA